MVRQRFDSLLFIHESIEKFARGRRKRHYKLVRVEGKGALSVFRQLAPGEVLGKYRIVSEIGRGGMGIVYLAEDTNLERPVALKVLPSNLLANDAFVARFRQEARAIAGLSHPNVVHINAFELIDGAPVIEMEYVEGGSLAEKLRREFVSIHDVVRYGADVASALAYCHGQHAVHRDVKPSNILIDTLNRARLADFGIAKAVADSDVASGTLSWSGFFQGTPLYAPPEAWEGEPPAPAWDIYSLGAVMFEALTGATPYQSESHLALVKEIATKPVASVCAENPKVSAELGAIVDRMLQRAPSNRPANAEEIKTELERTPEFEAGGASGAATVAVPISRSRARRTTDGAPRARSMLVVGAIAAVLAIAVLATLWNLGGSDSMEREGSPGAAMAAPAPLGADSSVEELLNRTLYTGDGQRSVFRIRYAGGRTEREERWLATFDGTGALREIVGTNDVEILHFRSAPSERQGEYSLDGHWAGYTDRAGSVLRYGRAYGRIDAEPFSDVLRGTLTFVAEQDGLVIETAFVANVDTQTDAQFIHGVEASAYVQPLIYNELTQRRFGWSAAVESMFGMSPGGRMRSVEATGEGDDWSLDGLFNERVWQSSAALQGIPATSQADLRVAASDESIYLGLASGVTDGSDFIVDIRLLPVYVVPVSASPVLSIRYQSKNDELEASFHGATLTTDESGVDWAVTSSGNGPSLELRTAYGILGRWSQPAKENGRWRLTAAVETVSPDGTSRRVCWWGFPDIEAVWHGVILEF